MKMQDERSAGIVVLRWTKSGWQYLALVTTMRSQSGERKLDFPKGHVEDNEDWFEAAVRETHEEAGISERHLNCAWGDTYRDFKKIGKVCRLFIAWTKDVPNIRKNPESGIYEHVGWKWLNLESDKDESLIHPYIQPAVSWARSIVLNR